MEPRLKRLLIATHLLLFVSEALCDRFPNINYSNRFISSSEFDKTMPKRCEMESYIVGMESDSTEVSVEVYWIPIPEEFVTSKPPCLHKELRSVIIRKCENAKGWSSTFDSSQCLPLLFDETRNCPDGFFAFYVTSGVLCAKISANPETWDDKLCYGSDKTIFDLKTKDQSRIFAHFIDNLHTNTFWLPAKRYTNDEISSKYLPIVWRLPGKQWSEQFEEYRYDSLSENECLAVSFNRTNIVTLEVTSCTDKPKFNLCLFDKLMSNAAWCPEATPFIRLDQPSICFSIGIYDTEKGGVELISDDFYMYNKPIVIYLLDQVGAENQPNLYRKANPDGEVMQESSKQLNVDYLDFAIDEQIPQRVTMKLEFYESSEKLMLTVYNRRHIFRHDSYENENDSSPDDDEFGINCFSNADYALIRQAKIKNLIWENDDMTESLFEIKLYGNGPGMYWCEAHAISDFDLIRTPTVIASRKYKGSNFAFYIEMPCKVIACPGVHSDMKENAKQVEKAIKEFMGFKRHVYKYLKEFEIKNMKIMDIVSVVPGEKITFVCHAIVSGKSSFLLGSSEESSEERIFSHPGVDFKTYARIRRRNYLNEVLSFVQYNHSTIVNSTDYCFTDITLNDWKTVARGMLSTSQNLCILRNGLLQTRKCVGNFIYGAIWQHSEVSDRNQCVKQKSDSLITTRLFKIEKINLSRPNSSSAVLQQVHQIVKESQTDKSSVIIPADLYYLGQIFEKMKNEVFKARNVIEPNRTEKVPNFQFIQNLVNNSMEFNEIFDSLMGLNKSVLVLSEKLNSTNTLLDSFENINDEISTFELQENSNSNITTPVALAGTSRSVSTNLSGRNHSKDGVLVQIYSNVMIFTIDPSVANITGIAVYSDKSTQSLTFVDYEYKFLTMNQSDIELLENGRLEIASYFPEDLWNRIGEIDFLANNSKIMENMNPKIVIKIYRFDTLFVEHREVSDVKVNSKIISVSVPGYSTKLPDFLPMFMRTEQLQATDDNDTSNGKNCHYWNYGSWENDGLRFMGQSSFDEANETIITQCGCLHLTPFAFLVGGVYNSSVSVSGDVTITSMVHEEALDIITLVGCSLSIVGVVGIFLTAIKFKTWRNKASTKVLLQLSIAILLQMILFCFINTEVLATQLIEMQIFSSCMILGALMHFSILVQFSWMFIIAYLQYKRYVQVLGSTRPNRFFLKSFVFAWFIPLLPVILILIIDRNAYIPVDGSKICYPTGPALYYGTLLPIAIVVAANLIIFLIIIVQLLRATGVTNARHSEKSLAISQLRLLLLLFFLLGLTWIFGFLSTMKFGLIFSYLFCLTATLQGFILFVYFVILDPMTRKLWVTYINGMGLLKKPKDMS